jgi:perosamine synthetase
MIFMIPVNEPLIGELEKKYVNQCLSSGWISSAGNYIVDFEKKWASYCGMKYGVAVSSGTAALQLAIRCLNLEPGDEIILPAFTIISCALAIIYNNCIPVLVDCDPHTWCMDISKVEEKITSKTRAVMPVHIYGHPVDMDPLIALAKKYDLAIIEDAAEAHGAKYLSIRKGKSSWKHCGGIGDINAFSFYANKIITTGEGGMILTNNGSFAENAYSFRNLCFRPERRFYHTDLGYNFLMTNLQAAIGSAQVGRINDLISKKKWMGRAYTERLKDIPFLQLPVEKSWANQVYWMYGIIVDKCTGMNGTTLANKLYELGVETRPFFLGLHEQPALKNRGFFQNENYPVSEYISRQGIYLPSGLAITETQLDQVCLAVQQAFS